MECPGRPAFSPESWRAAAMARFEWMASLPPRRMVALPVLKQRAAASAVTLGRLSKMMPMVPMGTRTCSMRMPLGRCQSSSTWPTGSGRVATCSSAAAMASRRFSSRRSRSSMAEERPLLSPAAMSLALAARISPEASRRPCAIAMRMVFFVSDESWESLSAAARAWRPISWICSVMGSLIGWRG